MIPEVTGQDMLHPVNGHQTTVESLQQQGRQKPVKRKQDSYRGGQELVHAGQSVTILYTNG